MTLVYYILGITIFALFISKTTNSVPVKNQTIALNNSSINIKKTAFIFVVLWIIFSILMGFREGFVDTSTYKLMVNRIGEDFSNLNNPTSQKIEVGFNIWMILCNIVSNSNDQFFIFITTAITLAIAFLYLYKDSIDRVFSIFIFITLYSFTFINGIRQALVAVILSLAYQKYKNRALIMIFICVLLSIFHSSVLLFIPIYFCIQGSFFNRKMKVFFVFALLCVLAPGSVNWLLDSILSDKYMETLSSVDYGAGIIRIIINSLPCIFMLLARKFANNKETQFDEMDNILLLDFAVNFCSVSSTYFARMSIYFGLFVCAYYPTVIKRVFQKRSQGLAIFIFTAFYSAFYLYQAFTFENYGYLREFYLTFMK